VPKQVCRGTLERCGVTLVAGKAVGALSSAPAAALVLAEILRPPNRRTQVTQLGWEAGGCLLWHRFLSWRMQLHPAYPGAIPLSFNSLMA
jgi:hypothetical protein